MAWAKLQAPEAGWTAPGVVVLDEALANDGEVLHSAWRRWLQLYNASQFLPGMLMVTGSGLDAHDYDALPSANSHSQAGTAPAGQAAHLAIWQEILDQTLSSMKDGLKALARAGADQPEVGMELADEKGRVLADAEFAWVSQKLVVLRPDQSDLVHEWVSAGWQVIELDESLMLVNEAPWQIAVAAALGLTLTNEEEECS
jgi:DEAD/DEAH box helicase domain-containing protein